MRVGIITYHFAQNYGSVLQCFALQEYLENMGYTVKIINFVSDKQEINNSLSNGLKGRIRNIVFFPINNKRKSKYDKFLDFRKKFLKETEKVSINSKLKKLIETEQFDFLISGSDQVFNPNINDFDYAFLFPFKTQAKKIAYAASLGNAKSTELNKLKKYILDFQEISLRESGDQDIFQKTIGVSPKIVCDPVFLIRKQKWEEIIKSMKVNYNTNDKYLLCYFIHKKYMNKSIGIAKKIAKQRNLKIRFINAGYNRNSFNKKSIVDCGPEDFLVLLKNADFVCTDSFHGTSFSTILNKDFLCFDTKRNVTDFRRRDLLHKLDLDKQYVLVENFNYDIDNIDFMRLNNLIEKYSDESKKILDLSREN